MNSVFKLSVVLLLAVSIYAGPDGSPLPTDSYAKLVHRTPLSSHESGVPEKVLGPDGSPLPTDSYAERFFRMRFNPLPTDHFGFVRVDGSPLPTD